MCPRPSFLCVFWPDSTFHLVIAPVSKGLRPYLASSIRDVDKVKSTWVVSTTPGTRHNQTPQPYPTQNKRPTDQAKKHTKPQRCNPTASLQISGFTPFCTSSPTHRHYAPPPALKLTETIQPGKEATKSKPPWRKTSASNQDSQRRPRAPDTQHILRQQGELPTKATHTPN